jgi:hypothetical protein
VTTVPTAGEYKVPMDDLVADLDALLGRFERELLPLDDAALDRRPAGGGWSARETSAHLETTVRLYLERLEALVERSPRARRAPSRPVPHGLVGGLLLKALRKPGKRIRAPRAFRPPEGAQGTVQELIAIHRRLRSVAETIGARRLERCRISTPISPLLRMPARTAVEVQIVHGARHHEQAVAAARG